jgi:hypothetical protein
VPAPLPSEGDVLDLAETDYLYGAGRLILRIQHIDRHHPISYNDEDWYPVRGTQISGNGIDIGDRETMVRGRRLLP